MFLNVTRYSLKILLFFAYFLSTFVYSSSYAFCCIHFIYSLCLFTKGVQRRQRRVLDTSSTYVRGEENLHGWRPRGDSLIFDHQWELEKLTRLEEVGRVRHLLLLRERLGMDTNPNPTTKTEKDVCNLAAKAATSPVHMVIPPSPQTPVKDAQQIVPEREYNEREIELMNKCLKLVQGKLNTKWKAHV